MMSKYDVGELIAALNEAVNKLNNLRTKYDDLEKENARLRAALREIKRRTQDAHPMSYVADYWRIAKEALGEKE